MPVMTPKRRAAFPPIGKLRAGAFAGGKKGVMSNLNLTPMVDMFTVIVIFLIQSFSSNGEIMFMQKDLKLPDADQAALLNERGPVISVLKTQILLEGKTLAMVAELDEAEQGIPDLAEKLTGIREREEKLYGINPNEPYKGNVLIQADKATDFMLVRRTIYSVNQAGWIHIQFAVTGTGKAVTGEGEGEAPAEG